ncbi:hypothetical protein JCM17846_22760 [Iodidimonas nitroreducens]|uniref:Uncharacterized protein n=2 Tax=Iodidimonas nitroreducens TaxID=1236968 RepID=A0A5A7NA34_9PROT|nr:hypothetical protein JCM17846_22760 [Iodidimonas nitroreducens]
MREAFIMIFFNRRQAHQRPDDHDIIQTDESLADILARAGFDGERMMHKAQKRGPLSEQSAEDMIKAARSIA